MGEIVPIWEHPSEMTSCCANGLDDTHDHIKAPASHAAGFLLFLSSLTVTQYGSQSSYSKSVSLDKDDDDH